MNKIYSRSALIPSIVLVNFGFPVSVAVNVIFSIFVSIAVFAPLPLTALSYVLDESDIFSLLYNDEDARCSACANNDDEVSTYDEVPLRVLDTDEYSTGVSGK